jgi:DNA (cytosine-5)-methyltransferase 1
MIKNNYKIVSLFSGCGGMDLGCIGGFKYLNKIYKNHPVEISFSTDFDKSICDLYNKNFAHKSLCTDIRDLKSQDIPKHDILTGGFPCQSFSVVAQNPKRLGYKDDKGQLFFEMCRVLKSKKPKVFIAENVKGILSANNREAFPLIIKEFENSGYHIKYSILNACHFGVPQKRERVFIIGFKDKKYFEKFNFPKPTTENNPITLSAIIEPTANIADSYYFSDKAVSGLSKTKHRFSMNKGRDQKLDEPCNTVGAHLAKVSLNSTDPVFLDNGRYRMFTTREVARIQSFPDTFQLTATRTVNYKALGNAVAPVMMWHVMKSIIKTLNS